MHLYIGREVALVDAAERDHLFHPLAAGTCGWDASAAPARLASPPRFMESSAEDGTRMIVPLPAFMTSNNMFIPRSCSPLRSASYTFAASAKLCATFFSLSPSSTRAA